MADMISAKFEVKFNEKELKKIEALAGEGGENPAMQRIVEAVVFRAKERSPRKKSGIKGDTVGGTNANSIEGKAFPKSGEVFTQSGYGGWLEVGTGLFGPHKRRVVSPTGKMMTWIGRDGVRVFAKSTKGMKAQPYLRPALDAVKADLDNVLKGVLE